MPKATKNRIRLQEQIEKFNDGELQTQPHIVEEVNLPTPEKQQEAIIPNEPYTIKLIDGRELELPGDLTVEHITKKRLDGAIMSLLGLFQVEGKKFIGLGGVGQMSSAILASDAIAEQVIRIVSKLCNIPVEQIEENINSAELVGATDKILRLLLPLIEKKRMMMN